MTGRMEASVPNGRGFLFPGVDGGILPAVRVPQQAQQAAPARRRVRRLSRHRAEAGCRGQSPIAIVPPFDTITPSGLKPGESVEACVYTV